MVKKSKLGLFLGALIILLNFLHAYWGLAISNTVTFFIVKLLLVTVFFVLILKETAFIGEKVINQRILLIIVFLALFGFNKIDFGSWIAPGSYKVAVTYTKEDVSLEALSNYQRIEDLYMEYGLYDTRRKHEMVTPLILGFEWRTEIVYAREIYPEYEFYRLQNYYYP